MKKFQTESTVVTLDNIPLKHPDGRPVHGGDLVEGRVYSVRLADGVIMPSANRAMRRKAKHKRMRA
jgi:hypothetical protein